jgi:hypothetical protein
LVFSRAFPLLSTDAGNVDLVTARSRGVRLSLAEQLQMVELWIDTPVEDSDKSNEFGQL